MMRRLLIICLAGFAGFAGWASQVGAGLFSSTGPVIAILDGELFQGEAIGKLDGSGTIRIQSRTKPDVTCRGQFTSSAKLGGKGNMLCSDKVTATIQFKRLTILRGYGTGSTSRGPMSFTYGLSAHESEPYLLLPPGKELKQDGKDLVLVDIGQLAPAMLPVTDLVSSAPEAAPDALPVQSH
jgi:hypothetical protein